MKDSSDLIKTKSKIILNLFLNILLTLFVILSIFIITITIISKKNSDGVVSFFGLEMRFVESGSMEKNEKTWDSIKNYKIKNINTKSCVFIKEAPDIWINNGDEVLVNPQRFSFYNNLNVGDVLTFKYKISGNSIVITHRLIEKKPIYSGEEIIGYQLSLRGDNVTSSTDPTDGDIQTINTTLEGNSSYIGNEVIGKVVGQSYLLGLIIYILNQPIGLICIIIIPCLIIIILEIFRIVQYFTNKKKYEYEQEKDNIETEIKIQEDIVKKQVEEIELLKKQLEDLKKDQNKNN